MEPDFSANDAKTSQIQDPRETRIGIVGAGPAGLITAHVLLQDGFKHVDIITKDSSVGGTWYKERVYPGLVINNVHGEFRFSPLPMPPPEQSSLTGGRLTGQDLCSYFEEFANLFLGKATIRYDTNVVGIKRISIPSTSRTQYIVTTTHTPSRTTSQLTYDKIVLCTGGCSEPNIAENLSPEKARACGFEGVVIHSGEFAERRDELISSLANDDANVRVGEEGESSRGGESKRRGRVVIVGGGKSAQDIAAYLAARGHPVSLVFTRTDAVVATPKSLPLPAFIRRSWFLPILSPHSILRTRTERWLHTTWLGSKLVNGIWTALSSASFNALNIPASSPLRTTHSLFYGANTNDEGNGLAREGGFHTLLSRSQGRGSQGKGVVDGKSEGEGKGEGERLIELVAPARVRGYEAVDGDVNGNGNGEGEGGEGKKRGKIVRVVLEDGRKLDASAIVLATGYKSSWAGIVDEETATDLGLARVSLSKAKLAAYEREWDYTTLPDLTAPGEEPNGEGEVKASLIYRGIVPAKNIEKRDFAVNGAIFTTNNGYTFETAAHWISSYFLSDPFLRLPPTIADATKEAERTWLRKRYPGVLDEINESYSGDLAFWTWPQNSITLLEDMRLRTFRSGGNWLTWIFKPMDLDEIAHLKEEREHQRALYA